MVQDTQDTDRWTVTVSIGRNVAGGPMTEPSWRLFRRELRDWAELLTQYEHGTLVFQGAGEGVYEDVSEDSYTLILADVAGRDLPQMRTTLGVLARAYRQDSIALTHGQTTFCRGDWSG